MPKTFKRMKPIAGPSRIQRIGARIRNEEIFLELLAKELPEHRIQLCNQLVPYLKFRLSPGFKIERLPDMPYTGPRTAAQKLEEAEAMLKQPVADEAEKIVAPHVASRFEQLAGKTMMLRMSGRAETSFEPAPDLGPLAEGVQTIVDGVDDQAVGVPGDGRMLEKLERHCLSQGMTLDEAAARVGDQLKWPVKATE